MFVLQITKLLTVNCFHKEAFSFYCEGHNKTLNTERTDN